RHTRFSRDWSSDVCSSDLSAPAWVLGEGAVCALGVGAAALREGVFAGRSGLRPRERLGELAGLPPEAPPAGEVPRAVWEAAAPQIGRASARERASLQRGDY